MGEKQEPAPWSVGTSPTLARVLAIGIAEMLVEARLFTVVTRTSVRDVPTETLPDGYSVGADGETRTPDLPLVNGVLLPY